MPLVNPEIYTRMLEAAQRGNYAYPAINVTSTETANAALKGFADAGSDGIIQLSTGAGEFAAGLHIKDMVLGSITIAEHIHRMADRYNVYIALHTDHCQPKKVDSFLKPLIAETARRRARGLPNLFHSHMFDGSELPLKENMAIAVELMKMCKENQIILEVETGVVGGEEDGMDHSDQPREKLYTTPADMVGVYEALSPIGGKFMLAATFGNVHGIYKPGNVKLRPKILKEGQEEVVKKFGREAYFYLVFHGGSGSELADIHETLEYGVIKMNIDTDTQYHFTEAIVKHVDENRSELTHTATEVANKKKFDPRSYLKKAEENMAKRVTQGCHDLKSAGKSLYKG
ncbi:MAG: class II fructose-bisphosphate aldolase [candidate division Zixibacteria bacterium]|nr:class II fructose-bisphosphate aldolase [candidate division Zixibacteria bacterium]MDD5426368.1 class II fructose-bisphosphate aldolase [candidate division Zixibacteria bacterium]